MRPPDEHRRQSIRRLELDPDPAKIMRAVSQAIYLPAEPYKLSWFGQWVENSDADTCPDDLPDAEGLTGWLRAAIQEEAVGGGWFNEFPLFVWKVLDDGRAFECRLYHGSVGHYYGYPITPSALPRGL